MKTFLSIIILFVTAKYYKITEIKPKEYIPGEKHLFRGRHVHLKVIYKKKPPSVQLTEDGILILQIRPGSNRTKKSRVIKEWYRSELKQDIPKLIDKWEPVMGVEVNEFGVKAMKTRWGTCNIHDRRIWLNLELVKRRPALLEYVVVHEMVHLLERLHNKRFYAYMDHFLPGWKKLQQELNDRTIHTTC